MRLFTIFATAVSVSAVSVSAVSNSNDLSRDSFLSELFGESLSRRADEQQAEKETMALAEYKQLHEDMRRTVDGETFKYLEFQDSKMAAKDRLATARKMVENVQVSGDFEQQAKFVEGMFEAMGDAATEMEKWEGRSTAGAREIYDAYRLYACGIVLYNTHGNPDQNVDRFVELASALYDDVYVTANNFYRLADKSETPVFTTAIRKAFQVLRFVRWIAIGGSIEGFH